MRPSGLTEASLSFDPQAATAAHVDALGPDVLARASAYTAGSHWLLLWGFVVGLAVAWLVVRSRILDRMEARLAHRAPAARDFVVVLAYFLVAGLLSLPWTLYEGWWRETLYGRTSQPFGDAFGQTLLSLAIGALLAALFFVGVYALIRRAGRIWWAWSGALATAGAAIVLLVAPVAIEPLFNDYQPLPDGPVRDAVRSMAKQAGIPADRIFVFDGSRQSNNFTANVNGLGPYARIALADVALKGASLDEVRAVTAHEMGHYVLGHVWRQLALLAVLVVAAFFVADRLHPRVARLLGSAAPLGSPAGLPVLMVIASFLSLLATPVVNATIRMGEREADRYSLESVNLPDALASALVKTAEYRDPRPGALQEVLFYTHPSVERRVRAAMEWKAAQGGTTSR